MVAPAGSPAESGVGSLPAMPAGRGAAPWDQMPAAQEVSAQRPMKAPPTSGPGRLSR